MTAAIDTQRIILVSDDEPQVRRGVELAVTAMGYWVEVVRNAEELSVVLDHGEIPAVAILVDLPMSKGEGREILGGLRAVDNKIPVIFLSGLASVRDVVAAVKSGATDVVSKPVSREELSAALMEALEPPEKPVQPESRTQKYTNAFAGSCSGIKEIHGRAPQVGRSGLPVLIQGETGSGKEVLARELHFHSSRANKPFLKLNCAALPPELVESELFGYEKGAFTGAFQKKTGIFELADGGTILLDEIGDMDVRLQAKLLQVLQDQEFRRIGGKETIKVDVRIIAATHRDLDKAICDGTFREDLYYRLSVIVLVVPSLRERSEDILPLGEFLLRKAANDGSPVPPINLNLRRAMLSYNWPGNVRELENYMRKLVIFQDPDAIARELYVRMERKRPTAVRAEKQVVTIAGNDGVSILEQATKVKQQSEIDAILSALDSTRWNRKQAASILKIDYKSLLYKMKKLGIDESPAPMAAQPIRQLEKVFVAGAE